MGSAGGWWSAAPAVFPQVRLNGGRSADEHIEEDRGCLCRSEPAEAPVPHPRERATPEEAGLPYLVPVMTPHETWALRAAIALWVVLGAAFWAWWLQPEHWTTVFGTILNSLLLAWVMITPAWFFFFVRRMSRPNPRRAVPAVSVAMIVTKAPSEPWGMVRETLEAMVGQDYPYGYDVWLADEQPSDLTLEWCRRHDVRISTRSGIDAYQRQSWPGRAKTKEGNLCWFYDHWGYDRYDVVVQPDSDHVPAPGYLAEMVRPFANPRVGYVAAPSMCDKNASESWAVRGRLYKEATLHGVLQTGQNGGYAPVCIGSHYAVRTEALREVGGIGPELAEDFSTSYILTSFGWEGVFAFDAEAHGDGPASLPDCLVQEYQWSRSLTQVLLSITPRYWRGLTTRQKARFGYAQVWYPLYAVQMVLGFLFPIIALTTGTPWVDVPLPEFFLRAIPVSLVVFGVTVWFRANGWLRPQDAKFVSWEIYLFQLTRWPWVLWGVGHAFAAHFTGREFSFKVTPKQVEGPRPFPLSTVVPFLVLSAVSGMVAVAVSDPGAARGYYYLCLLNAGTYLVVAGVVTALHLRENRPRLVGPVRDFVGQHFAAVTATGLIVVAAFGMRGRLAIEALTPAVFDAWLRTVVPAQGVLGSSWFWAAVGAIGFGVGLLAIARDRRLGAVDEPGSEVIDLRARRRSNVGGTTEESDTSMRAVVSGAVTVCASAESSRSPTGTSPS